jgi:hypothetical protein
MRRSAAWCARNLEKDSSLEFEARKKLPDENDTSEQKCKGSLPSFAISVGVGDLSRWTTTAVRARPGVVIVIAGPTAGIRCTTSSGCLWSLDHHRRQHFANSLQIV